MASNATKNVIRLYILTTLTNLWFFTGSWLYFYRLYMSDRQIGVLDGFVFGIGLLTEIPSGALADRLGRKRQLLLGLLLMSGGFLLQGFAAAYWHIFAGMALFTIGMAFVSGSDDALVYDSLDAERKSNLWGKVIARKFQIMHFVTIISILAGGVLYVLQFRLPFVLAGVGALAAFLVALTFKEAPVETEQNPGIKGYVRQNIEGMQYLFHGHMWLYAFMAFVVLGVGYAFDVGVIKPLLLDSFGFTANAQAVINAVAGGVAILVLTQLTRLRKVFGEKRGLVALALLMAGGFFASSFPIAGFGLLAFLAIFIANSLAEPWFNDVVQHEVPSSHRATALSTLALIQKLPYVALSPIAGAAAFGGSLSTFFLGLSGCIALAVGTLLAAGLLKKRSRQYSTSLSPTLTVRDDRDASAEDFERLR
jgi:MFS family permease